MANYIGFCRSSYFKVKDLDAFTAFCAKLDLEVISKRGIDEEMMYGFISNREDGAPDGYYEDGDYVDVDFPKELSKHLADGWVAVYQEIGYEKMRYFTGYSVAVNSHEKEERINIDEIYQIAEELWENEHSTMCQY
jgi:hypothetical protein